MKKTLKDPWAILDEFEAPMWADLSEETKPSSYDNSSNDHWFFTSHPFHMRSSRQLKAEFANFGHSVGSPKLKGCENSPKIPPSVSRSRGKSSLAKVPSMSDTRTQSCKSTITSASSCASSSTHGKEKTPQSRKPLKILADKCSNKLKPQGPMKSESLGAKKITTGIGKENTAGSMPKKNTANKAAPTRTKTGGIMGQLTKAEQPRLVARRPHFR